MAFKSEKVDPKHLKCVNPSCRHPKSFHKSEGGCSAFGCKCKTKPGANGKFEQIKIPSKD